MLSITNKLIKTSNNNKLILFNTFNNNNNIIINNNKINFNNNNNNNYKSFTTTLNKSTEEIEEEYKKENKKDKERYDEELNEYYSGNGKHEKLEKSKRHINQKKYKRVSPVEVFRSEIDSNKDAPQVDYVEGKLHSFPPTPGSRRTKLRNFEQDEEDDDDQDYRATYSKDGFEENDDDDFLNEDEIENYGKGEEQLKKLGYVRPESLDLDSSTKKSDFDKEEYERGFYSEADIKKMKKQLEYERKKEAERDERRKKKLVKLGFKEINDLEKRREDLALQIRQKGDRRLKYLKYPILSENTISLAALSFNFFKLNSLIDEKILYNDDVLDVPKLSVINVDGTKLGEMSGPEAYRLAYIKKLDIFLQYTPVGTVIGRLMRMEDYITVTEKKFVEDDKKRMDSATKSTKNVLFSATISDNDRLTKISQIKNFLIKRHTVEVTVTFKNEIDEAFATQFFKSLESELVGIAKAQASYGKKGGKIASNFYHPLNVKDRENYIKRVQKEESESERKLREQLEREEIDLAEESGREPDMAAITIKVNEIIRKKKMEQMFDDGDLNLLLEDERKQQKKTKQQHLAQLKDQLAPTQGEGLSNKQIKQNLNKNKNKLKREQRDEEELF